MAAEGSATSPGAAPSAEAKAQPQFCSSVACQVLSSVPFFVAGAFLLRRVRHTVAGQPERLRKPSLFASLGLGVGLMAWGLTLFIHAPKKRNP